MDLKNKVVIVTGASRGIGKATALRFCQLGAKVVVNYKVNEILAELVIQEMGQGRGFMIQADVTKEKDVSRLIKETKKKFGRIDVLVNNAGEIVRPGDWQSNSEIWQKTLDINLKSAWLVIKETAPLMLQQKSGVIVNVTSVFGQLGAAPVMAYTSAKGGLITLTKSFAKELAPYVRVNAVAPSNVMTDMSTGAGKVLMEKMKQETPLKRIANPEEIAQAITFLASSESSYITGHILVVDGGYSLK